MFKVVMFTLFISFHHFVFAIEFSTENSEATEVKTIAMLKALMVAHDLENYTYTNKVHIDKTAIPHSHPILTLHTRHSIPEQKDLLLSTYLHEQFHWYLEQHQTKTDEAIRQLKMIFPNVPVGYPEGARDEYSTYLHLIVCYLEISALSELISDKRVGAVELFWQNDHYTWVYKQIEEHNVLIAELLKNQQLTE